MKSRKQIGILLLALLMCLTAIPTKLANAAEQTGDVKGEIILSTNELILDESDAPDYNGRVDVTVVLEGDYSNIYNAVVLPYQCDRDENGQLLLYCDSEKSTLSKTVYSAPMYFGTQKVASTYTFNQVELLRWSDGGRDVTRFEEKSFIFDKQFQDKEAPQLLSVSIDKQGQTVTGSNAKITIKVQDNGELRDSFSNEVSLDTPMHDDEYYNIIKLTYQGDGIYTATASMFTNYEWYIRAIKIYDVAGNCCFVEYDQTSPYYFYVETNGICNKTIFEDLNVNLYDNEGKLITTLVKDVERRSAIGDVLGKEYLNGTKQDAGEFLGWSIQPNGTTMDESVQFLTGYKEMITSVNLYEVYKETEGDKVPEDDQKPEDDIVKPEMEVTLTVDEQTQIKVAVSEDSVAAQTASNIADAINDGKTVQAELIIKEMTKEDALIENLAVSQMGETVQIHYFDISIVLKAGNEELGTLNKLKEKITITVDIPEELKAEGRTYKVIRNHNGEVTVLDSVVNKDGTISFETDRFSTYALAYVDEEEIGNNSNHESKPSTENNTQSTDLQAPQTADNRSAMIYVGIGLTALFVFVVLKRKIYL